MKTGHQRRKTILSVHADSISHDIAEAFLQKSNVRVIRAFDGLEALSLLFAEHVDLVLTSIMLPKMSGFDLAQSIRNPQFFNRFCNNSSSLPIVALSSSQYMHEEAYSSGINECLLIPVPRAEFVQKVELWLDAAEKQPPPV